jgi:hypothetical protein
MQFLPISTLILLITLNKIQQRADAILPEDDIQEALNTTNVLIEELDALRTNELGFLKYFMVHIGAMFNSIEHHMKILGVSISAA